MKNKKQQLNSVQSLMQQRQLSLISVNKWCSNINHEIKLRVKSTLIHLNKLNKTIRIFRTIKNRLLRQNNSTNSKLRWHFQPKILNSIWVLKFILTLLTQIKEIHHQNYKKNLKNYISFKSYKNGSIKCSSSIFSSSNSNSSNSNNSISNSFNSNNSSINSNRNNIKSLTLKLMEMNCKEIIVKVQSIWIYSKTKLISLKESMYFIPNKLLSKPLIQMKII